MKQSKIMIKHYQASDFKNEVKDKEKKTRNNRKIKKERKKQASHERYGINLKVNEKVERKKVTKVQLKVKQLSFT